MTAEHRKLLAILLTVITISLCEGQAADVYHGKLLSDGWGADATNGLSGSVYAVNKNSFQVINFTFDGLAGNSVFLLGKGKSYSETQALDSQDPNAVVISGPSNSHTSLKAYTRENIYIEFPNGTSFAGLTYIAVYSRDGSVFVGGFDIPSNFVPPAPRNVGKFSERAHDVSSGNVTILDDRTIRITNLRYDGQGPDAFFYVGVTDTVTVQQSPYGKIPDENGIVNEKARAYSDRDITLTLPAGLSVTKLKWLSIYCITYRHNFGEVFFPDDLNVPPYMGISMLFIRAVDKSQKLNCESLSDDLQVSWLIDGDSILIELAGNIDQTTDYMSFGLSGSEKSYSMVDADVVVADWTGDRPKAVDYKITAYSQCASNGGACPDTDQSNGGIDNIEMPTGELTNGITRIKYKRPLVTGDSNDKEYKTDGTAQQIVWAIGPINTKGEAAKHYSDGRITTATTLNFGREAEDNCQPFEVKDKKPLPAFLPHHIYGDDVNNVFTAEIGQSASEQGYKAITGSPSWGIAWYINGMLVPELHLQRGVEYTFTVAGGFNSDEGSMYHPLYITTDVAGGKSEKPNSNEVIYPGYVNGKGVQFAVGPYCEWKLTPDAIQKAAAGHVYQCFEEFKDDLNLTCSNFSSYTEFKWTADSQTPNTLYYQCYTHENLGWKINIYDQLPPKNERKVNVNGCLNSNSTGPSDTDSTSPNVGDTSSTGSSNTDSTSPNVGDRSSAVVINSSILFVLFAALLCYY